jgi:hypothetical protein
MDEEEIAKFTEAMELGVNALRLASGRSRLEVLLHMKATPLPLAAPAEAREALRRMVTQETVGMNN